MGWTFMTHLSGHATPRELLDRQFTAYRPDHSYRVLGSVLVGMRVYYAAVEHVTRATGSRSVFAAVCPIRYSPDVDDGFLFGYRISTEDALPYDRDCPEVILELLTPTERANAIQWRTACRREAEACRLGTRTPPPRPGQIIIFDEPIRFGDGSTQHRLRVVSHPHSRRAVLFRPIVGPGLYRIPNVKRHAYQLVDGQA